MAINAYEISAVDPSPAQQCVLPTFLIASRKNRRNLFTSFPHNIQTSGAARFGFSGPGGHKIHQGQLAKRGAAAVREFPEVLRHPAALPCSSSSP